MNAAFTPYEEGTEPGSAVTGVGKRLCGTRAALTARAHADLDALLADLPAAPSAPGPEPEIPGPGRYAVALKSSARRAGGTRDSIAPGVR